MPRLHGVVSKEIQIHRQGNLPGECGKRNLFLSVDVAFPSHTLIPPQTFSLAHIPFSHTPSSNTHQANRFLKFVDTVYDAECAVVVQAEANPYT